MTREQLRRIATRTVETLESFSFYYNMVMFVMWMWGIYALVAVEPATAVSEETSSSAYTLWMLWHVLAPPAVWIGQVIPQQRVQWPLRCSGDSALCAMIGTHFLALQQQNDPDMTYWKFFLLGIGLVMLFATVRDVIRAVFAFSCEK